MTSPSCLLHCQLGKQVSHLLLVFLFEQVSKARSRATCLAPPWEEEHFQACCAPEPRAEGWAPEQAEEKRFLVSLQSSTGVWDFVLLVRSQAAGSQMFNWTAKMYSSPGGTLGFLLTLSLFPDPPKTSLLLCCLVHSALTTPLTVASCSICGR